MFGGGGKGGNQRIEDTRIQRIEDTGIHHIKGYRDIRIWGISRETRISGIKKVNTSSIKI